MKGFVVPPAFQDIARVKFGHSVDGKVLTVVSGGSYTTFIAVGEAIFHGGPVENFRTFGYQRAIGADIITPEEADRMQRDSDDLLRVDEAVVHEAALRLAVKRLAALGADTDKRLASDVALATEYFARRRT